MRAWLYFLLVAAVSALASCSAEQARPHGKGDTVPPQTAATATGTLAVSGLSDVIAAAAGEATALAASEEKPLSKEDILSRAAPAVAFVLREQTNIIVTAFCVDPSGLFLTHERAGQYGGDQGFRLVLNAGQPTERVVQAKIIHSDATPLQHGLALVRAEDVKDLPTLSLGTVEAGTDGLDLTSVGFPFTIGGGNQPPYPQAKAHTGKGKPVWQLGELTGIKHDRELHGANYGGPLLDARGRVVGVLAPSEAAVPVTRVRQFLADAQKKGVEVALTAPADPPKPVAAPNKDKPAVAVALQPAPAAGKPLSRVELAKLGKAATAFVRAHGEKGVAAGSAFCVHPSGLFVTNEHVVTRAGQAKKIDLVLNSGEAGQRVLTASVLRVDKEQDLALLRAEKAENLPTLALGAEADLIELMELVAFGFPFGSALAVSKGEYPSISINAGSVTSLRRKGGELAVLQVDIVLNPGNSGGPVLDNTGRVVGVVVAIIKGTGVNFVIPVNLLRRFLAKPELQFTPPALARGKLHEPALFQARALLAIPAHPPLVLELILRTPDGKERRQRMEAAADGTYRVTTALAPAPAGPTPLRLAVKFPAGSIQGAAVDQPFSLNGAEHRLRDLRRMQGAPKPRVTFLDGKMLDGTPAGLDAVPLRLGSQEVRINLGRAAEVQVETPGEIDSVTATVVASQDGKEVDRISTAIPVAGATPRSSSPSGAALQAPVLEGDKVTVALSAPVADVAVGGGGRFLVLHLARQRKLAIFDVNEAKIVHSIPLTEDNVKFAAGLDKLVIVYPREILVQRWSLTTFAREAVTTLTMKVPPIAVAMGSASQGPLCISGVDWPRLGETVFFDVQAMKRIEGACEPHSTFDTSPQMFLRASADGKVFVAQMSPGGALQSCYWTGSAVKKHGAHGGNWPVPGPDGRAIYTSQGSYTADLKPLPAAAGVFCLPAHHGPYYLGLGQPNRPRALPHGGGLPQVPVELSLYAAGDARPLARLPLLDGLQGINLREPGPLPLDKRIHLLPDAKCIVLIPAPNDRLVLYRFDPEEALEKAGIDYLLVTSRPPPEVARGESFRYQVVARAKRGPMAYRLESAPQGMAVARDGLITWAVPADFAAKEVTVLLTVRDAAGQECHHTFTLGVRP